MRDVSVSVTKLQVLVEIERGVKSDVTDGDSGS